MTADSPLPPPGAAGQPVLQPGGQPSAEAGGVPADLDSIGVQADDKQFRGWRLLGVLFLVIIATAVVSAIVDFAVIPR